MVADSGPLRPSPKRAELAALVSGMWSWWSGLDPLPTAEQVAEQLGPPLEPDPHSAIFGGSPTLFRRYAFGDDAVPVTVWYEDDLAVGVEIDSPRRSPDDDPLGAPDEVLSSEVGDAWEQHVYGAQGLVLHLRSDADGLTEVRLLFGLAPFDATEFHHDPLRWAGRRERYPR